jgi:hypothetical protein
MNMAVEKSLKIRNKNLNALLDPIPTGGGSSSNNGQAYQR